MLVRRWLCAYGPGTEADLVWWLGATKTAVRRCLDDRRRRHRGLAGCLGLSGDDDLGVAERRLG